MSRAAWVGFSFAAIHAVGLVIFLLVTNLAVGGEDRLYWTLWIPVDFPVSLLVGKISSAIPLGAPYEKHLVWLPHAVHGLLGTAWWFFIPYVVARLFKRSAPHKSVESWPQK